MAFLTRNVRRVDLGDGYWADMRELSSAEYLALEKIMSKARVIDGKVQVDPDLQLYRSRMVEVALVEWNLTDEDDHLLPIGDPAERTASVGRLPIWAFDMLRKCADDMNGERPDAGRFRSGGSVGGADGDAGATGAGPVPDGSGVVAEGGPATGPVGA